MKTIDLFRSFVLAIAVLLVASPALAAVDMYIQIEGIPGESEDPEYLDWSPILNWKIAVHHPLKIKNDGKNRKSAKATSGELSFTKSVDNSTTILHKNCCNGKTFPRAQLVMRKAGQPGTEYVLIKLTDLIITSVSTGGSGGEDRVTENVTLNFGEFKAEYIQQREDGSTDKNEYGWNIEEDG